MMGISNLSEYLRLNKQISIAPLVTFRVVFGALLFFGTVRFMAYGWVEELYIVPDFYFTYLGFEWVQPLPDNWMYVPFVLLLISSLGILFGAFYRISATLSFFSFTYVELLDKTNYLNHYYFVSLILCLLIFVPANRAFSIDTKISPKIYRHTTPQWSVRIIQFQLACVYVFAGLAKLNSDWLLDAQPLKVWLQSHRDMPLFGSLLAEEWVAYLFSWFGCLYDLFIVFFLFSFRFQKVAYLFVVVFHVLTWVLFPIGVFPWVMIGATLIFMRPEIHGNVLSVGRRFEKQEEWGKRLITNEGGILQIPPRHEKKSHSPKKLDIFGKILLIIFITAQLALPLRFLLYPTNVFWTEEGFRFSWRVMLMHKEGHATFFVKDRTTQKSIEIINSDYLTERQEDQMATQPDMILQYASHLEEKFKDTVLTYGKESVHLQNPSIHARVFVTLNGRPNQLFVSDTVDLTKINYNFAPRKWITPFKE